VLIEQIVIERSHLSAWLQMISLFSGRRRLLHLCRSPEVSVGPVRRRLSAVSRPRLPAGRGRRDLDERGRRLRHELERSQERRHQRA
jgi:hypothetical protein